MKKILVIDDNEQDRMIMERFLRKGSYGEVVLAETGEDGIKKMSAVKPDLVITDTVLPGIDGFEVCRQIKESYGPEAPKVIIVTGSIDAVDAVKARKAGANDYCAKSSTFIPLKEALGKLA